MSVSTNFCANTTDNSWNGLDYISSLPNGLLGDILSLLPIKDAMRTCVLSKDWKLKWTLIFYVNIDANELFPTPSIDNEIFVQFMGRMLMNVQHIKSFHLNLGCVATVCEEYEVSLVITWISIVLEHNIESIELRMWCDPSMLCDHADPILPHMLLKCVSLKNIVLEMPCTLKVAVRNWFPNLTGLYLDGVTIQNENSKSDIVTFDFPVLREFKLEHCKWLGVKLVEIKAPSLSVFNSSFASTHSNDIGDYSIKIVGAELKEIIMTFRYPENIILTDSTADYATLGCCHWLVSLEECGLKVRKLLEELSHIKYLSLVGLLESIAGAKLGPPLPRFSELQLLTVFSPINVEALFELLHAAPFLKILYTDMCGESNDYDYDAVEFAPSCLLSHLKMLRLDFSECTKPRSCFYLAKFLFQKGAQLKNVQVCGSPEFPTNEIIDQLLTYPKASKCLKIEGF